MRYKIIWFSCVLIFTTSCFCKTKKYLYYFDNDFNPADKVTAVFNGIGVYENGLIKLEVYSSLNKNLVYSEHYTDSSLQLSEGLFQSFYENASKEWEGNYLKGKEDGLWQQWDNLGRIIDSTVYINGEKARVVHIGYYKNGILDSFIVNNIKTGQLQKTYYDSSGKVKSEATKDMIEPSFPGGPAAWTRYILKEIMRNTDELNNADYGTCIVKFIVNINGKVTGTSNDYAG